MRPGRAGELIADILVNEEITATRLNKNAALLKTFAERLAHKNTTIHSLGDNAY